MKANYLLIILFGLVSSFTASAQNKDEQAIRKVMNKQVNAWNSGDIDAFMTTYWKNDSLVCWLQRTRLWLANNARELQEKLS